MARRHHKILSPSVDYGWKGISGSGKDPNKCALYFYNPNNTSRSISLDGYRQAIGSYEISTDGETWVTWTPSNLIRNYTIPAHGIVYVRNASTTPTHPNYRDTNLLEDCWVGFNLYKQSDAPIAIGGNVKSMLCRNYNASYTCTSMCLFSLFYSPQLSSGERGYGNPIQWLYEDGVSASSNWVPLTIDFTTLADRCYESMFSHMYAWVNGMDGANPGSLVLPAGRMANSCYASMFIDSSIYAIKTYSNILIDVSAANTTAISCFAGMFQGCGATGPNGYEYICNLSASQFGSFSERCFTSFLENGNINATAANHIMGFWENIGTETLGEFCFSNMFKNSDITRAYLPLYVNLASGCYYGMYQGCTSLVDIKYYHGDPILPAMVLASQCYRFMFQGCTSLLEAPILPATYGVLYCYNAMFSGCTNISYLKCLLTSGLSSSVSNMLANTSPIGVLVTNTSKWSGITAPTNWSEYTTQTEPFWIRNETPDSGTGSMNVTIRFTRTGTLAKSIVYRQENNSVGTGIDFGSVSSQDITVNPKKRIFITTSAAVAHSQTNYITITSTSGPFSIGGILATYFSSTGYSNTDTTNFIYSRLFNSSTNLKYAHNLDINRGGIGRYEFQNMFNGCTNLIYPPQHMTRTANGVYMHMFRDCVSLLESPIISPETQTDSSMEFCMFYGCSALKEIRIYCTSGLNTNNCRSSWVTGVGSVGKFYKHTSATDWTAGIDGYPSGWTVTNADSSKYYTSHDTNKIYYLDK